VNLSLVACQAVADGPGNAERKPNLVFILADDLGYGDLGCYGQKLIQTPAIDRLAQEGMRFSDCYAGSTVCAPSRCVLMTGKHTGHARIRGNALVPLEPEDVTVAEALKSAGYATGIVGKWGLGEPESTGLPNKQGFDSWFGYLNQKHAHNYYPDYLWRNETRVDLPNQVAAGVATKRVTYSGDLFQDEALEFIEKHQRGPFFLYLASTLPHANNEAGKQGMEVPSDEPYANKPWPQAQKNHAAMITRLDTLVGRVMQKLAELKLDQNTIVFISSDNGPHKEGGGDPAFFHSSGPLQGIKRSMHDGGIRVPMIVRYPGKISAGSVSSQAWSFCDVLPTLAELAGATPPPGIDGISVVPTLLGAKAAGREQPQHTYLYWEFSEGGFKQALRAGKWKAIRPLDQKLQLYDLSTDLAEQDDVAAKHPDIVAQLEGYLKEAHVDSADFPIKRGPAKKK